jgi:hypothetical protein
MVNRSGAYVGICTYTLYPSSMIETLHTDRLLLQPLRLADAEPAQRLFPRWEIVRFMSTLIPWPYPADGALRFYRDVALPAMERGEAWHWSLRLRESVEELIGVIRLVQNCHLERSVAEWRDLRFLFWGSHTLSKAPEVRLSPSFVANSVRKEVTSPYMSRKAYLSG